MSLTIISGGWEVERRDTFTSSASTPTSHGAAGDRPPLLHCRQPPPPPPSLHAAQHARHLPRRAVPEQPWQWRPSPRRRLWAAPPPGRSRVSRGSGKHRILPGFHLPLTTTLLTHPSPPTSNLVQHHWIKIIFARTLCEAEHGPALAVHWQCSQDLLPSLPSELDRIGSITILYSMRLQSLLCRCWHPNCFRCSSCGDRLEDLLYFYSKGRLFCGRDFANLMKIPRWKTLQWPWSWFWLAYLLIRCNACDELIFSTEYTGAEGGAYHLKHFCCWVKKLQFQNLYLVGRRDFQMMIIFHLVKTMANKFWSGDVRRTVHCRYKIH